MKEIFHRTLVNMRIPKKKLFCMTHPQKVFVGGFLLGYLLVKDFQSPVRKRKSKSRGDTSGLLKAPFAPLPYRYPCSENPRDSYDLMLNHATLAHAATNPPIIDHRGYEEPTKLSAIHYDYEISINDQCEM
ncbi:uncharacterized protein LOC105688819 [Athalia rosae]|uniref:uncharacterized protein LOC105688819 n=1 Tax=Athalia rosae TaxID=37344 RepID=UPI00203358A7|nr:uncharacterized protein LOC105688819 [Athalia rosae]